MKAVLFTLAFFCLFALAPTHAARTPAAQETAAADLGRLRELAKQSKADPEPWREYGEALARSGDTQGAVRALAEAVNLYVKLFTSPPPFRRGKDMTMEEAEQRNRAHRAAQLRRAPEAVERYIQLGGAQPGFEREQLEALAVHARLLNEKDAERTVFNATELDHKARLLSKPEPILMPTDNYGLVRLRAVLAADGTVKHVFIIKGQSNDIAEACIEAARRIKFEPAVKDGKPVSQFITVEYNYH